MKRVIFILCFLLFTLLTDAKEPTGNMMRDNGKILVVVAVMLTILGGLILYLVRLDRKISKLEKNK